MSIYAVRIKEWYGNSKSAFYEEKEMLESMIPSLQCCKCGNSITFKKGYVMHSITFGGPDEAYCSENCVNEQEK